MNLRIHSLYAAALTLIALTACGPNTQASRAIVSPPAECEYPIYEELDLFFAVDTIEL